MPVSDPLVAPSTSGPFTVALALSVVFHSVLLLITFQFPDALSFKRTPAPIEVVLVNSKSRSRPLSPDALAQADLEVHRCKGAVRL